MRIVMALAALFALVGCGAKAVELGGTANCGDAGDGTPLVLATGQPNPNHLVVDSANVYWTNSGSSTAAGDVMSAPLCGGTAVTVAPPMMIGPTSYANPSAIAVNGSSLFWVVSQGNGYVLTAPIGGGSTTTLETDQQGPLGLVIDSTNAYWVDNGSPGGPGAVVKAPLAGGTPTTLATPMFPNGIAVDSDTVYFTADAGGVFRVPIAGGATTTITKVAADTVAVDATNIYWTVYNQRSSSVIMKAAKRGGPPVTLVSSGLTNPGKIATDGSSVYWTDTGPCSVPCTDLTGQGKGSVGKVSIDGGKPVILATGQEGPNGIAIDSKSVYWTTQGTFGNGSILKLTPK